MKKISIAVDGPSAAGKSSIAKIVAKRLDYRGNVSLCRILLS